MKTIIEVQHIGAGPEERVLSRRRKTVSSYVEDHTRDLVRAFAESVNLFDGDSIRVSVKDVDEKEAR